MKSSGTPFNTQHCQKEIDYQPYYHSQLCQDPKLTALAHTGKNISLGMNILRMHEGSLICKTTYSLIDKPDEESFLFEQILEVVLPVVAPEMTPVQSSLTPMLAVSSGSENEKHNELVAVEHGFWNARSSARSQSNISRNRNRTEAVKKKKPDHRWWSYSSPSSDRVIRRELLATILGLETKVGL
nr:hypothetical protein Iba_chr09bCG12570 [Ipomoea batatas]